MKGEIFILWLMQRTILTYVGIAPRIMNIGNSEAKSVSLQDRNIPRNPLGRRLVGTHTADLDVVAKRIFPPA
jgi:hypothetical protein